MSQQPDGSARVVAVPCFAPGGLETERSGHFGHCDCFTVITLSANGMTDVKVVENVPHQEGGCLDPVRLLGSLGVTDIVVGGMGARPLALFADLGIAVYVDQERPTVQEAIEALIAGRVPVMSAMHVCGGSSCH